LSSPLVQGKESFVLSHHLTRALYIVVNQLRVDFQLSNMIMNVIIVVINGVIIVITLFISRIITRVTKLRIS